MAKVKIIDSYSLGCFESNVLSQIEEADAQIITFEEEIEREQQHRQNQETLGRLNAEKHHWSIRREIWHQCSCKIKNYTKEIEI